METYLMVALRNKRSTVFVKFTSISFHKKLSLRLAHITVKADFNTK